MLAGMEYRGIEYTVVQGVERGKWCWTVSLGDNISKSGQAIGKEKAVDQATHAINRALAVQKVQLVPPGRSD